MSVFDIFKQLESRNTEPSGAVEYIICGLGNPGTQYENTRHNIGFMTVDTLCEKYKLSCKKLKFKSLTCDAVIGGNTMLQSRNQERGTDAAQQSFGGNTMLQSRNQERGTDAAQQSFGGNTTLQSRNQERGTDAAQQSFGGNTTLQSRNQERGTDAAQQSFGGGKRCLIMKPTTFMNNSGEAVTEAMNFYKIPPERTIIVFDDISLEPGKLRIRRKGSDGGHNGIKSIIYLSGSDAFPRIKMGVGAKPNPDYKLADWVLGHFKKEDGEKLEQCFQNAVACLELIVQGKIDEAMNKYNS